MNKYEQETMVLWNQTDKTASVYTHDPALIRRIEKMHETSSVTSVTIEGKQIGSAMKYIIPKSWIKVRMPHSLTEEERQRRADRARLNLKRKGGVKTSDE